MAALPLAPRLAHLLLHARQRGLAQLGVEIVALLEERDVLRGAGAPAPADLRLRLEALRRASAVDAVSLHGASVDRDAMRRVRDLVQQLQRDIGLRAERGRSHGEDGSLDELEHTGALLALAYPDRVAQRRAGSEPRFLMRAGTGASVLRGDGLADCEWLAIAELDGSPPEYRVARAAPITRAEVLEDFGTQVVSRPVVEWHDASGTVRATQRSTLGVLVLGEHALREVDPALVRDALVQAVQRKGVAALPWSDAGTRLRQRLAFLHANAPERGWPDVSDAALTATLEHWLAPHLEGLRRWSDLASLDWSGVLLALLPWDRRAALDTLAPTHLEVPSGSRIAIDYSDPAAPVLAVKLQEVFGWTSTPLLCDGRVPVTLHLLSPAQRPVQVTRDLAGFWRTSYFEVRKELRGRYPRHPWPEDPLTAVATRRAKPRGT